MNKDNWTPETQKRVKMAAKQKFFARLGNSNVETNVNTRWKNGVEHDPRAEELALIIGDLDFTFADDSFCFKFGGDGDNGETLAYLLDIYFELLDEEKKT